jgi:predicted secreted protein
MHGPFMSLRGLGWSTVAAMAGWLVIAGVGAFTALHQYRQAGSIAAGEFEPTPLLGLGGVAVAVLFLATGALFVYWLWCARINVPHLIRAHPHFGVSWTIAGWLVPPLNLWRPFEVIDEVDRFSAEARADGDARVPAERGLLVPWWLCTVAVVAVGVRYEFMAHDPAAAVAEAASWQLGFAALLALAAMLAATVVLRITYAQEHAHAAHAEPVPLHRGHGRHAARMASMSG